MTRLVRFVERHAALVACVWILAAACLTVFAPSVRDLGTADQTAFLPASAPSSQADALLRRAFPDDPSRDAAVIVLARPGGLRPADRQYIGTLTSFLHSPAAQVHVKAVQSAADNPELAPVLRATDSSAELLIVSLRAQVFTVSSQRSVTFLRDHLSATAPPGLQEHVTGLTALTADQADATIQAFDRTAIATVILVLLILILVYRSLVAPLISLLTIGSAFLVTRGTAGYLAEAGLGIASLAETFMIVMAFGAGTDYVMFVLSRYRDRAEHAPDRDADELHPVVRATAAVSPTVIASGVTVALGFGAFFAAQLGLIHSFGPVLGLAVAITVLASLTLTPALMRLVGNALFWPRRFAAGGRGRGRQRWVRIADVVARRPLAVLLISLLALALPASAATHTRVTFDVTSELPTSSDARQGFELLAKHYPPGLVAPASIVVSADSSLLDGDRLAAVDKLTEQLRALPGVAQVRSVTQPAGAPLTTANLTQLTGGSTDLRTLGINLDRTDVGPLLAGLSSPGGLRLTGDLLRQYPAIAARLGYFLGDDNRTTRIVIAFNSSPYAPEVLSAVRRLDKLSADALAGTGLSGARVAIAGPSAFANDVQSLAASDLRSVGALALATILLVLAVLVRSVVAPLYLLASVIVSMLAALGITTLVFQDLLGEHGLGFYFPIAIFVMLAALGSDYNIFIVGRIREELDAGHSVSRATTNALISTGPTITAAGFVLAGTFAALLITPLPSVRQLGFGVAAGIFLDTFLVRTMLVPAATILLGERAFWPSTSGARGAARPRVVAATAALIALAIAMPGLAFATRGELAVQRVPDSAPTAVVAAPSARPTTIGAATAQRTPTPRITAPGTAPSRPPTGSASAAKHPRPGSSQAPTPTAAPPAAKPGRIVVSPPSEGVWTYHVEGSRTVGAAGTAQPFAENDKTTVNRSGGSAAAPEFRLTSTSSFANSEEKRRYTTSSVDSLAQRVDALGLSYGGSFDVPQRLFTVPARVGATWASRWRAAGTNGTTTATVTGVRQVVLDGRSEQCFEVTRTTDLSGEVSGTQHQRTCWIPALGMPFTDDQHIDGSYRGIQIHADVRMSLVSHPTTDASTPNSATAAGSLFDQQVAVVSHIRPVARPTTTNPARP